MPISNFAGWVLVVYVIMQIFALTIASRAQSATSAVSGERAFWAQAVSIYFIIGLGVAVEGAVHVVHCDIFASMGMVAVFTMIFTAATALLNICREDGHFAKAR